MDICSYVSGICSIHSWNFEFRVSNCFSNKLYSFTLSEVDWCLFLHLTNIFYHNSVYQTNVYKSLIHHETPCIIAKMAPSLPPSSMKLFMISYSPAQCDCLPPLIPYSTLFSPFLQFICTAVYCSLYILVFYHLSDRETQLVCSVSTSCSKLYSPCTRLAESNLDPTNPSFLGSDSLAIAGRGGSEVIG